MMLFVGIVAAFVVATVIAIALQPPPTRYRCSRCARPVAPTLAHCGQCGAPQFEPGLVENGKRRRL